MARCLANCELKKALRRVDSIFPHELPCSSHHPSLTTSTTCPAISCIWRSPEPGPEPPVSRPPGLFRDGCAKNPKMHRLPLTRPHIRARSPIAAISATDDDDAMSDCSCSEESGSVRKPLHTFEISSPISPAIEDDSSSCPGKASRKRWWDPMVLRSRRAPGVDELVEESDGLLTGVYTRKRANPRRSCYNYCIFGGISGLTVL